MALTCALFIIRYIFCMHRKKKNEEIDKYFILEGSFSIVLKSDWLDCLLELLIFGNHKGQIFWEEVRPLQVLSFFLFLSILFHFLI